MQRYGQKTSKIPPKWWFSPFVNPKFIFKNRALSLLHPYDALTSCKKLDKTNGQSLRYSKMDGPTIDDRGDCIGSLRVNQGPKLEKLLSIFKILKDGQTNK